MIDKIPGEDCNEEHSHLTPIMRQYLELKEGHKDCLLFFRLGDFYELFFDDAILVSNLLGLTLTQRDKSRGGVPMCGMPAHASDSYISKLVKLGYKVAICEQMDMPATKPIKGPMRRQVVRIITQGTATDDILLEPSEYNFILSMSFNKSSNTIGLAFVDVSVGDFFVESVSFNNLLSSLFRMQPKEVLVENSLFSNLLFADIMKSWRLDWRCFIRSMSDQLFDYNNAYRTLLSFYNVSVLDGFGVFSSNEIMASGVLFDYIRFTQVDKTPYISAPIKISNKDFVEIDAFTRNSLDIIDTNSGLKNASLFYVLDSTITKGGSRLLKMNLSSPLRDIDKINERLDCISFFLSHNNICENVRNVLKNLPDISRILSRICLHRWSLKDISMLKVALIEVNRLRSCFADILNSEKENDNNNNVSAKESCKSNDSIISSISEVLLEDELADKSSKKVCNLLKNLFFQLGDYDSFCNENMNSIRMDNIPISLNDGDFILSGFCHELDDIRLLRDDSEKLMLNLQHKYVNESGISNLKIKRNNIIGYYIEIPQSQEMKALHSFIRRQSTTNTIRYVSEELSVIEDNIENAQCKAKEIETKIVQEMINNIVKIQDAIHLTASAISQIDVFASLAVIAKKYGYIRPIVDMSEDFIVHDGKHPVVDMIMQNSSDLFIPNDCILTYNEKMWLLTGPNMAGKSTFLRQNALIAIIAQSGSFVPAKYAKIGCIDKIFSRIGASDDIARGRSTFMVEMIETALILRNATPRSFVILDELGRGTSTQDGLAIAVACLEKLLYQIQCRTLFATHYHEIPHMVEVASYNMKIKIANERMLFLYKLAKGNAENSYGIYVAKLASIPEDVISRAEEILTDLSIG
ncbi:DNA mismatch repair protein MutS [Candidatus Gromoviella agglomerans]|uniref:DNA mismatch repair protein MutS n=1 Tax=Candidatus Gromoviella agglomerans TaxID=2806609 RepID=UPI001E2F3BD0|nr:DNA mismatch repair protein MutS [Candidatus Gromoviella agglomerans]UFX98594.1 DNA mismatch repair protein MutS [Candidatus Gromoviella agglomerans]